MHEARSTAHLSAEDIQEFQALLRLEIGREPSAGETGRIVERLLRLYRICETAGRTPRPVEKARIVLGGRPATQRALETEATLALRTLQEHLSHVGRRPSTWRWAVVALHSALRYALQARLVAEGSSGQVTEDMLTLFQHVGEVMPELPQVGASVEQLDSLRWRYVARQLSVWPIPQDRLRALCLDAISVIRRLRANQDSPLLRAIAEQLTISS